MQFNLGQLQRQSGGTFYKTLSYLKVGMMFIVLSFVITFSSCERTQEALMTVDDPQMVALTIAGGAPGGTFSPFANAVSNIVMQHEPHLMFTVEASPGAVENTRRVNDNPNYLGVTFVSESYLGYHGQDFFAEEGAKTNIRVVTLLYIAYAQAAVLADSDIQNFADVAGRKVANGAMGSGSAKTIERLTRLLGIWDEITPVFKGGNDGVEALVSGEVDVFQWLVSVPNEAMAQLAASHEIRMLNMDAPAQESGFYEQYPFYQSGTLPADAYEGKVAPVNTLLMPTLLIAHKDVPAEAVYTILKRVYTAEGLEAMIAATGGAAADMTIENAPKVFITPLHTGAYKFWREQGVEIPEHAMPVD